MEERGFRTYTILRPMAWVYSAVTSLRNLLYDKGVLSSYRPDYPLICVGNITAGGTGKTPHTEYLARLLQERYRTAVLSRGYGRRTGGYILAGPETDASVIGDEPYQMSRKLQNVAFAVCEKRAIGLKRLEEDVHPDAVLLDDAFQHRAVTPSLNILLVNWHRNITDDRVIPEGLLREPVRGKDRADIIIVTKCPDDMTREQMEKLRAALHPNPAQSVYFTRFHYCSLVSMYDGSERRLDSVSGDTHVVLATGVASPAPIMNTLKQRTDRISQLKFPDHHEFSDGDMNLIWETLGMQTGSDRIVIVTEKDAAKIRSLSIREELERHIYILPVTIGFLADGDLFDQSIINHIENFRKQS